MVMAYHVVNFRFGRSVGCKAIANPAGSRVRAGRTGLELAVPSRVAEPDEAPNTTSGLGAWEANRVVSRQPGAPVTEITVDQGRATADRWPYTLPVVRHLYEHGLTLNRGVTVLIGGNGTGKSTVVEALAAAWARRITAFRADWLQRAVAAPSAEDSDLHRSMRLAYTRGGPTGGLFLRGERLHAQAERFQQPRPLVRTHRCAVAVQKPRRGIPGGARRDDHGAGPLHPPRPPASRRWTSFVAIESPAGKAVRGLHEQGNPRHRLRVEHDGHTLLTHLSDEDGAGWTTVALDRATRKWAVAQDTRQTDTARGAYEALYESPRNPD